MQGKVTSSDVETAARYSEDLVKLINESSYIKQHSFNIFSSSLYRRNMSSRIFTDKKEKSVPDFKASKDRLTLLLGANAAGDLKSKPMLIYRSENPRALKELC